MNTTYTTIVMLMTHRYILRCDNIENAITDVIMRIEICIKDISSWMMHNSLQINENKTEYIIFSTTPHKLNKHTLQVGTNIIGMSKHVKVLGVTFNDDMTLTLSDPGYFRQLTIRGGGGWALKAPPPPKISKTILSISLPFHTCAFYQVF